LSEDIINHKKALKRLDAAKAAGLNRDFVGGLLRQVPGVPQLFSADDLAREAKLQRDLAWLDSRALPLQKEIRNILIKRTASANGGFTICLEGNLRTYKPRHSGVGFTHVSDEPMVCDKVDLKSSKDVGQEDGNTAFEF
jgi:hypothetical protein